VIRVENLSKKYPLSRPRDERYAGLRDIMAMGAKNLGQRLFSLFTSSDSVFTGYQEDFYALKDISFEIKEGDRVGIIGCNGAGKSTLLKILSRITEPTAGRIEIKGRVASLLEVGTGFHPELSGRENIYLNGAILGMSKAEIRRKFNEIVDFAEVEKFLDTPVKRYSSGMYVRLAFAVAAHLEPEILVVDEVLAVGDAQFQKKCLGKMEEVGKEGRTVLFVSHNMTAITSFCNKGVLLNHGKIICSGRTSDVIDRYLNKPEVTNNANMKWNRIKERPYEDVVIINSLEIIGEEDQVVGNHLFGSVRYSAKISIELIQPNSNIRIGLLISHNNQSAILLSSVNDGGDIDFSEMQKGNNSLTTSLPISLFNDGDYYIEIISLVENAGWILSANNESRLKFTVVRDDNPNPNIVHRMGGVSAPISPVLKWKSH